MKFCPNCGAKLDEDSIFCASCGNKVKNNTNSKSTFSNKNDIFTKMLSKPKLIILIIILIIALIGVSFLASNIFSNDLVDVTKVDLKIGINYGDTPFGGAIESSIAGKKDEAQRLYYLNKTNPELYKNELPYSGMTEEDVIKYWNYSDTSSKNNGGSSFFGVLYFSIIPKETISNVNELRLDNVEITYNDGQTQKLGNIIYSQYNAYMPGNQYDFKYSYDIDNSHLKGNEQLTDLLVPVHIKGDIVVNTLNEKNKVIGHIDYDVTPSAN